MLVTLIFVGLVFSAHAQWTTYTMPQSANLYAANMQSPENIYVSGAGIKVFHRGQNGTPWHSLSLNSALYPIFTADAITGIHRLNDTIMVAVLSSLLELEEYAFRSIDGGANWQVVHSGPDLTGFNDLVYLPSDRCIAVGHGGRIVIGTDLGATWTPVIIPTQASLRSIDMYNTTSGFVGGHGVLLHTTTSGASWTVVYEGTESIQRIAAQGPDTLYATARDGLDEFAPVIFMRSFNGGSTWEHVDTPFDVGLGIAVTSDTTVHLATALGIHRSTTSGESWHNFPEATVLPAIKDIDFHDPMNGIAVGHNNSVQLTNNSGGLGSPVAFFTCDTVLVCTGGSIAFANRSPTGFAYEWSVGDTSVANSYNAELTFDTPGFRTVTLRVSSGSTQSTFSRTVHVIDPPLVPSFSVNLNIGPACQGSSRLIRATYTGGVPNAFRFKVDGTWVTDWIETQVVSYLIPDLQHDLPIEIERRVNGTCGPVYASAFDTLRVVPAPPSVAHSMVSDSICLNSTAYVTLEGLDVNYDYRAIWTHSNGTISGTNTFEDTIGPVVADQLLYGDTLVVTRSFSVTAHRQGCPFTVVAPLVIWALPVRAEFELDPPYVMIGEPYTTMNNSIGTHFTWTFPTTAQPNASTDHSPQVSFLSSGLTEIVRLEVTNVAGCTAHDSLVVEVMAPLPTSPVLVCAEDTVDTQVPMFTSGPVIPYRYKPMDMVTDHEGAHIITGYYRSIDGNFYGDALFLTKIDRQGNVVFDARTPQRSHYRSSSGVAVDVDNDGNIFMAGISSGSFENLSFQFQGLQVGEHDGVSFGYVVKLSPSGEALWRVQIEGIAAGHGISDVQALPDGSAVIVLNRAFGRTLTLSNEQSIIVGGAGVSEYHLLKVDREGHLVVIKPGPTALSGNGHSPTCYEPDPSLGSFCIPFLPRLSLACDGSIQVWSTFYGATTFQGLVQGEPSKIYTVLASIGQDLDHWTDRDNILERMYVDVVSLITRPRFIPGKRRNTTILAITSTLSNPNNFTVATLPNGSALDGTLESIIWMFDETTGDVLWERNTGGLSILHVLPLDADRFVVVGEGYGRVSILEDGLYRGRNDLQQRDIVLMTFNYDGELLDTQVLGSSEQDIVAAATTNGCEEITMLVSLDNEVQLIRASLNGTCAPALCDHLQFAACVDVEPVCANDPVTLNWQVNGDPGPLRVVRSDEQAPEGIVLGSGVSAAVGYFTWNPAPEMYDGSSFDLFVIDQFNDTLGTATVELTPPITADLAATTNLACSPDSIALIAATGYTHYQWSHISNNNSTVFVHESGTYSLTVMNAFGCIASDTTTVTILPGDLFSANDTVICGVPSGLLQVPGGFDSYTWSTGYEGPLTQQPIAESGSVIVSATSSACVITDSLHVDFIPPITISVPDQSFCIGSLLYVTITPDIPVTYSWAIGGSASTHIILPNLNLYSLTVTDPGGCTHTVPIIIQPMSCVGIDESGSIADLMLQPNPASIAIQLTHPPSMRWLNVYDPAGRRSMSVAVAPGSTATPLDITTLASGTYVIEVISDAGTRLRRVFVKD